MKKPINLTTAEAQKYIKAGYDYRHDPEKCFCFPDQSDLDYYYTGRALLDPFTPPAAEPFKVPENVAPILKGRTFAITGTASRPRREIIDIITAYGGSVSPTVTRSTSLLLTGDDPGEKLRKAQRLGIRQINADRFIKLLLSK